MYTLRLTGCIYVHECMSTFMHNKVQVGRHLYTYRRAGGQIQLFIVPSILSFLYRIIKLYILCYSSRKEIRRIAKKKQTKKKEGGSIKGSRVRTYKIHTLCTYLQYMYIRFGNRIVPFFSFPHMKKKRNFYKHRSIIS